LLPLPILFFGFEFSFKSEQRWQYLAGFSQIALCERKSVHRFLRANVDGSRVISNASDETGRGFYHAGGPDCDKKRACVERVDDLIHLKWGFAEPANVRANPTPAFASRNLGGRVVSSYVVKGHAPARVAAAFEQLAVHVNDALRSRPFVEIVDILCAKKESLSQSAFELREYEMTGVRFRFRRYATPH
jgi:hypothetical protein